jgi:hypothetical protein
MGLIRLGLFEPITVTALGLYGAFKFAMVFVAVSAAIEVIRQESYGEERDWVNVVDAGRTGALMALPGGALMRAGLYGKVILAGAGAYFTEQGAEETYRSAQQYGWGDSRTLFNGGVTALGALGATFGVANAVYGKGGFVRNYRATKLNEARIAGHTGKSNLIPTPRINIADKFKKKINKDGSVNYTYGDPNNAGHGLIINIDKNGTLGFDIARSSANPVSGLDMFSSAMLRLKADGVNVSGIRGFWISESGSVNYSSFMSNIENMGEVAAALNTWTGRIAQRYGFNQVSFPNGVSKNSRNVTVLFGKGAK